MNVLRVPLKLPTLASVALPLLLAVMTGSGAADARGVPEKQIPPSVLLEVKMVEAAFDSALANDCAPDRCYTKGCAYEDHVTLDQARSASLPGLPVEEGPGGSGMAPQDYLTRVRCGFAYEKTIEAKDVQKLARRLRKRLSHGWLTVAVTPSSLEPIPKSLQDSPPEEPVEEVKEDELPLEPVGPEELTGEMALRQLWDQLLPHVPWMLAIFFLTLAILMLIWAGRRLGTPSLEDKMLEAQLKNGPPPSDDEEMALEPVVIEPSTPEEEAFAEEQEAIWTERVDRMEHDDDGVVPRLLREWLRSGEFATLARALFVFGDKVSPSFDDVPELALKKVDFAEYFRDVDENDLPSRARFFRQLNQQAMASMLLSQDDVQVYRSLREDFGEAGVVSLMDALPARYAALLFALVGDEHQREVAVLLTPEMRTRIAAELLATTRISLQEGSYLAECVDAIQTGADFPATPTQLTTHEHGSPIESARALSMLLPYVSSGDREVLFNAAMERHGGQAPGWYEEIAFSHMLSALPDELRADVLLEVDVRALSAWLSVQMPQWREAFLTELSGPLRNALRQNSGALTRAEQTRWATRGHDEIVRALKGAYAQRGVRFVSLIA